MADPIPTTEDSAQLDQDAVESLRKAGILLPATTSEKGNEKTAKPRVRHVTFVDEDDAGRIFVAHEEHSVSLNLNRVKRHSAFTEDPTIVPGERLVAGSECSDLGSCTDPKKRYLRALRKALEHEARQKAKAQKLRLALMKELSARLKRDTTLRHAIRESEMQRHLMAPGARSKIRGPERVDDVESEDFGDSQDQEWKRIKFAKQGEVDYKPRVYKWRSERKR